MADAASAFLTALYGALGADTQLGALISAERVAQGLGAAVSAAPFPAYLMEAPADEPEPFITYNIADERSWHDSDGPGAELIVDLHIWTRGTSPTPNFNIAARLKAMCFDPAWALSGASLVLCRTQGSHCDKDGDGFHGVVTLRALVRV